MSDVDLEVHVKELYSALSVAVDALISAYGSDAEDSETVLYLINVLKRFG